MFLLYYGAVLCISAHVKQELLTRPEHLSSFPIFSGGSCCSIFSFLCNVL